ncbi:expressed unknown protein [Seminavis robusta]|uniref:Uncharacterized protein n=1 Tax=Seminavis robusta TaxID=568900 RepID=A0A9N8DTT9_9STRA|nr:expressed unknown protein [Seminavis robusta]|eukprot:Sro338_g120760.1 n/a (340) ;mRNA; r:4101-5120
MSASASSSGTDLTTRNSSSSTTTARPPSRRKSGRRSTSVNLGRRWMDVVHTSPPWNRHFLDIGRCGFVKCTKQIQKASAEEIAALPTSYLAMAISASTAYTPKEKQERLLMDYTRALVGRNVDPNDIFSCVDSSHRSAVACAAYHGYPKLLKLLLVDGNCSVTLGTPHALMAALDNGQHECMTILLEHRKEEFQKILYKEELAHCGGGDKHVEAKFLIENTLEKALIRRDVTAVQILRDQGNVMISDYCFIRRRSNKNKILQNLLQAMYGPDENVMAWSKWLHWSFPTTDRRMINYLWHLIAPNSDFPKEVWLNLLSFMGRGWWMESSSITRQYLLDVV